MGHGGTLDPMARGVLILGVGNGTKALGGFLECTKSYEAVVLFGVGTDSYDAVGGVVTRRSWEGVTREKVEEALGRFRGKIMQRPPVFSALKVQGKKMYEYARAGEEVPIEIQERPVEVQKLEMVEWMEGGSHEWQWPTQDAEGAAKNVRERSGERVVNFGANADRRKRAIEDVDDEATEAGSEKRAKVIPDPTITDDHSTPPPPATAPASPPPCPAPACRLRMTVTSGFYVRSLCHDLGITLNSAALMSDLVRTRQGDFEISTPNVLEYDDLAQGEEKWGPRVQEMLAEWQQKRKEADVEVEEEHEEDGEGGGAEATGDGQEEAEF